MNKQNLVKVLKDPESISSTDLESLKELAKNHPYSQLLHALVAKGSYIHAMKDAQKMLHISAMYTTNRQVLKALFDGSASKPTQTKKKGNVISKPQASADSKGTKSNVTSEPVVVHDSKTNYTSADELRAEVMRDLENLMHIKKVYSDLELTVEPKQGKKTTTTKTKSTTPQKKKQESKPISKTQEGNSDNTLNQIDIIDSFIKKEPSIRKKIKEKKSTDDTQEDLSKPSAEFGDDLISENLAQILVKQGKNAKAIDIYKKLIWKFPQKKAYFATQIEALKK